MTKLSNREFTYRGHQVHVSRKCMPAEWQGINDMIFTVRIDGRKTDIPGLWTAYRTASEAGVEMVIKALLDTQPMIR